MSSIELDWRSIGLHDCPDEVARRLALNITHYSRGRYQEVNFPGIQLCLVRVIYQSIETVNVLAASVFRAGQSG
jgi:hypothetical protein